MGGSYDALRAGQAMGRYTGTAVPRVTGLSPGSYPLPQGWASPAVSGRDLIVQRDVLRKVAADLARMADHLQATLSAIATATAGAANAAGNWPQARQLAAAAARAHAGVTQFTSDLRQAHHDTAARLLVSADRYDAAEQQITTLIHAAADPSATIIGAGGQDKPVQPGYGQNWTPQQRAAYYRIQRLENMPGNGGPVWTGTFPITEDVAFSSGAAAGYTWEQVQSLLAATDPGAISTAGIGYGRLTATLTDIAGRLAGHGQTLAANWGGPTAVTAVSQIQQLYQTAADLQANTWAAQQALQWYGPVLAAFRTALPQPASAHPADVAAANQAAQQRMTALNGHIGTAYYQLPGAVNKNLPPPLGGSAGAGSPVAAGAGYGAGGSAGAAGGAVALGGASPASPHLAGYATSGGSTRLAGTSAPVAESPTPPVPAPPPQFGGSGALPPTPAGLPPDFAPGGPGFGPAPAGEPGLPSSGFGESPAAGEPGLAGEQALGANGPASDGLAGAGEAGAGDMARLPGSFPANGAGGLGEEAGGGRQYWTAEDEATWGPDVMPGQAVIGGDSGADGVFPTGSSRRGQPAERARLVWLGEDDDFWGLAETAVPPVIGA